MFGDQGHRHLDVRRPRIQVRPLQSWMRRVIVLQRWNLMDIRHSGNIDSVKRIEKDKQMRKRLHIKPMKHSPMNLPRYSKERKNFKTKRGRRKMKKARKRIVCSWMKKKKNLAIQK